MNNLYCGRYFLLMAFFFVGGYTTFSQENGRFLGDSKNIGEEINSPYDEFSPVFSPDGMYLYFTRSRHPENVGGREDPGDIWVSKREENGKWTKAENAGKVLNNKFYNEVIGFSPDGQTIYLNHHYATGEARPRTQGFSYAKRHGDGWSAPQPVKIDNFYNRSNHQSMALSSDGKVLVLAINSYGSYGHEDLYVSFLDQSGTWTEPKNMGSTINTAYQEMTPFIAKDNKTIFFASNGHGGKGSRDIFTSRRLDNSWRIWSEPVNITEINSEGIELSYTIGTDGEFAYFVSTQNSDGYGDINKIQLNPAFYSEDISAVAVESVEPDTVIFIAENPEVITTNSAVIDEDTVSPSSPIFSLEGQVFNKKNESPIKAKVTITPIQTQEDIQPVLIDVEGGHFDISLQKALQYKVRVSAEGYMPEEKVIQYGAQGVALERFYLSPLEVGSTFQLNNVLFERGTANLIDSAYQDLDKVVEMMNDNPKLKIEIGGHTDNQGDARLNLKLSQERVETVIEYLINRGLSRSRIVGKGYGGTRPIASNQSENTRKLNRRVEFTVLK